MHTELDFLRQVFSNPVTYNWSLPITHLIKLKPNYEESQDACLMGGGGFSFNLHFWWIVEWPSKIASCTIHFLKKGDKILVSINMLKYDAIIISLAASIISWEALPNDQCPIHPMVLSWTNNTTAEAWTKCITSLKGSQGKALARVFAYLLMFSDVGIHAAYNEGKKNTIAHYLSCLRKQNNLSCFQYHSLVQQLPWLKQCCCFLLSQELLLLVYNLLSTGYAKILDERIPLRQIAVD
jgi:hypothetical protein